MRNLREIGKLVRWSDNNGIGFTSDKQREVRLLVNASEPCQLMIQFGPSDMRFLANVDGFEELSFMLPPGDAVVWPDCEGQVWYWTPEMELISTVVPDAETFTKIATRRARNPELERMMAVMQQNTDRRIAAVTADLNAKLAAGAAPAVASLLAGELHRDPAWRNEQVRAFAATVSPIDGTKGRLDS